MARSAKAPGRKESSPLGPSPKPDLRELEPYRQLLEEDRSGFDKSLEHLPAEVPRRAPGRDLRPFARFQVETYKYLF
jgi:hypothetical protein